METVERATKAEPPSPETVARLAEQVAEQTVRAEGDRIDASCLWPEASFKAAQAAGLTALVVPTEYGGWGYGLSALASTCATFGYESPSFAISYGMHCVGAAVIAAKATPEQADAYLRPIAEGKHITTLALSEPGTGSHFYYPQTRLRRDNGRFTLDGSKSFITNGGHADSYVVSTATEEGPEAGVFSCVLVPGEAPGLVWDEPYEGIGMRGNSARTAHLQGVQVDESALLGAEGDQIWYVFNVVAPYFLMAMAGTYLGLAKRALAEATDHLAKRVYSHDGTRLADAPVLQHRLGEMWARYARTRALVEWAAEQAETGGDEALPALCSAKAEVAECATRTVNDAMTIIGGQGYRSHGVMGRMLRDARAADVMAPTTDLLRIWTGRALLGIPLLGE